MSHYGRCVTEEGVTYTSMQQRKRYGFTSQLEKAYILNANGSSVATPLANCRKMSEFKKRIEAATFTGKGDAVKVERLFADYRKSFATSWRIAQQSSLVKDAVGERFSEYLPGGTAARRSSLAVMLKNHAEKDADIDLQAIDEDE